MTDVLLALLGLCGALALFLGGYLCGRQLVLHQWRASLQQRVSRGKPEFTDRWKDRA